MAIDDEGIAALDRLSGATEGLRSDVQALRRRWRWMAWAAAIAGLLLLVSGLNFRYSVRQASCTSRWANEYAARSAAILPSSTARADALDHLVLTLAPNSTETAAQRQADFQAALSSYLQASKAYSQAVVNNALPVPPSFNC